jgi:[ribosomal protein S5]-alanine N-acetyltransferase
MDIPNYDFETERLGVAVVRPTSDADIDHVVALFKQPLLIKDLDGIFKPDRQVLIAFHEMRKARMYDVWGYGNYIVYLKPQSPGQTIRRIGTISMVREANAAAPDVGYAMMDEERGHGYASEAIKGLIKHAQEKCGVTTVLAITSTKNRGSLKLLERCDFKCMVTVVSSELTGTATEYACYAFDGEGTSLNYQAIVDERMARMRESQQKKE